VAYAMILVFQDYI